MSHLAQLRLMRTTATGDSAAALDFAIKAVEASGVCEACEQLVAGWKPVLGFLAPEWFETMREQGIDPRTGHKLSCARLR